MELPSLEPIKAAQQDLEEITREYHGFKGKNAVLHSTVALAGTMGAAYLLAHYFGERSIAPLVVCALSGGFLAGTNLDKIGNYLVYLAHRKRDFAEDT
ncbi:MAG: hypothetical protein AABY26_02595, partial [Nanoarchaeota archaeon]